MVENEYVQVPHYSFFYVQHFHLRIRLVELAPHANPHSINTLCRFDKHSTTSHDWQPSDLVGSLPYNWAEPLLDFQETRRETCLHLPRFPFFLATFRGSDEIRNNLLLLRQPPASNVVNCVLA